MFLPASIRYMNSMNDTHKKKLKGMIVSHKGNKTAIVEVHRYRKHPIFKKYMKRSKRYKAHDELNQYAAGDAVFIQESRPISKYKHWVVISKVKENTPLLHKEVVMPENNEKEESIAEKSD